MRGAVGQIFNIGDNTTSGITCGFAITGTVYLVVSADGAETGTYTVSAVDAADLAISGLRVDEGSTGAGNSIAAANDTLISGNTFGGTLSSASDQDFIAIDLTAGTEYTFDLQGAATGNGTLADGFLVLSDSNNNFIAQDDDSGTGEDAQIVYAPTSAGTFYIAARTFGSEGGTYALVTRPLERAEGDFTSSASAQVFTEDTSIQDDLSTLDDAALLPVPNLADDTSTYSLIASDNTGAQTQAAAFEGGADVHEPGESYVTSADAADILAIVNEAGLG